MKKKNLLKLFTRGKQILVRSKPIPTPCLQYARACIQTTGPQLAPQGLST